MMECAFYFFVTTGHRVCIFDLLGISEGNATQGSHQSCCFVFLFSSFC